MHAGEDGGFGRRFLFAVGIPGQATREDVGQQRQEPLGGASGYRLRAAPNGTRPVASAMQV